MLDHIYTDEVFDWTRFERHVKDQKEAYLSGSPFPHAQLDGFFSDQALEDVLDSFPALDDPRWDRRDDVGIQVKLRSTWKTELDIPPKILLVVQVLQSGRFVRLLSEYTGIHGLMPDYWFGGGGLNQILPGGELAIHVDGTHNDDLQAYRRVNLIVFLNKDWREEYGGHLELWDEECRGCVTRIAPTFNTIALFNTSDLTYHGHPYPLSCPEGMSRKSLILYYYTTNRPQEEVRFGEMHRALFSSREELGI